MRSLAVLSLLAVAALTPACGGASFTEVLDGGGGEDAGAGQDGGSSHDAGGGTDGGAVDSGGTTDAGSCDAMKTALDALRAQIRSCNGGSGKMQCQVLIQDTCCPFTGDSSHEDAINSFNQLLPKYTSACGPFACPAIACLTVPSGICDPTTNACR